ncbi:MAG TPA: AAA family ATPase [Aquabacterium sp.]|nr:AAA family ATPase [Aquabacterium sp.]
MADGSGFTASQMTVAEVEAIRAELRDSGYWPVPVWNHDTPWLEERDRGKVPVGKAWQFPREPGPVDARALNTGILCAGLRAIDIDIDNPTIAHAVKSRALARFGEAPLRYRDNEPRVLLLYRAAEGEPEKEVIAGDFGKVEVLGKGQQFVGYGTHRTGAALRWMPDGPTAWALDALPAITEEQVHEFLAEVAHIIGAKPPGERRESAGRKPSDRGQQGDFLDVMAALRAIPNDGPANWEFWNKVGMVLWGATGGSEAGRQAWHDWSSRHSSYDEAATEARWRHYSDSPPGGGAGTLFALAREQGWRRRAEDEGGASAEQEPRQDSGAGTQKKSSLIIVCPAELQGKPIPPRQWIVENWLPVGYSTLNYADGGSGKTLVAQMLQSSTAYGTPWLGMDVERCRSFALYCEDDNDELHRRQAAICDAYGIQMRDLNDMRWTSGVGEDNTLVTFDHLGRAHATPRFDEIAQAAVDFGARLVIIDTAADTFGGNENDRGQVRQFIGKICGGLARKIDGAVLVNAHPSRSGMASGDLDGGSTAWSNSARSRWSMARPKGDDVPLDTPERILTRRKSNYASIGEEVRLRWEKGVFVPSGRAGNSAGTPLRQAACQTHFLSILDRCTASNIPVSNSKHAGNWAPKVFAKRPDADGYTLAEFDHAMAALFAQGEIILVNYGRAADERRRIARRSPGTPA